MAAIAPPTSAPGRKVVVVTAHSINRLGESITLSYETRLYLTTAKPITR
jgi:hypothetical protein